MSSTHDPGSPPPLSRRTLLVGGGLVAVGGVLGATELARWTSQPAVEVFTASAAYDADLQRLLLDGLRAFPRVAQRARGGTVVLKPNLVEFSADRPINTDPRFVAAAVEAFRELGARRVVVAEGPGHRRDTEAVVEASGLAEVLASLQVPFVDLNADRVVEVPLADGGGRGFTGLGKLPVAATIMAADLVVSLPKLKTHHWAGVTLSMKNLFGTVPGRAFGWPKNPLHWAGISRSVVDLWRCVAPGFAIVDGVVGMQGDGPIQGSPLAANLVVMGEQLPAVDATAARLMGLDPSRVDYLAVASTLGGTVSRGRITTLGDALRPVVAEVLPRWEHLRR